ncbi:MAG: hypothetical protein KDB33_12355 [Acidimicrobiales bacterium]|nr:hypothetical protein [Acidimicrobiales bacterium]
MTIDAHLRDAADRLERALDPEAPPRPSPAPARDLRGRAVAAAVAAAVVAVVLGAGVVWRLDDPPASVLQVEPPDERALVEPVGTGPWAMTWLPDGYRLVAEEPPGAPYVLPTGVAGTIVHGYRLEDANGRTIDVRVVTEDDAPSPVLSSGTSDYTSIPVGPLGVAQGRVTSVALALTPAEAVVVEGTTTWETMLRLAVGLVSRARLEPGATSGVTVRPEGLDYREAQRQLLDAGVSVRLTLVDAADVAPGTVVASTAGTDAAGRSLTVLSVAAPTLDTAIGQVARGERPTIQGLTPWGERPLVDGPPAFAGYSIDRLDPPLQPNASPERADTGRPDVIPIVFLRGELVGYVLPEVGVVRIEDLVDPSFRPAPTVDPDAEPPVAGPEPTVPEGWSTVEAGGVAVSVPPGWTQLAAGCPGTVPATVFVGEPDEGCAPPDPSLAWLWLRPEAPDLAATAVGCAKGAVNGMSVCSVAAQHQTLIVDGFGSIIAFSNVADADLAKATSSLRYSAGIEPVPADQDALGIASAFVVAWYGGDCVVQDRLIASDAAVDRRCGQPLDVSVASASLGVLAPTGGAATVEVETPEGPASWDVAIVVGWSDAEHASVYRVRAATPG